MLDQTTIEKALAHPDARIQCAAVGNCRGNTTLSLDLINQLRHSLISHERQAAMFASYGNSQVPAEWLFQGLADGDFLIKDAAVRAFFRRSDIPIEEVEKLLRSELWYERYAGINACIGRQLPSDTIEEWIRFMTFCPLPVSFRGAAAAACIDNVQIPFELVERILCESNFTLAKILAGKALRGKSVPTSEIIAMLHHTDRFMQIAGLYAYTKDLSIPHIEIGEKLISDDATIRKIASKVCDKSVLKVLRVKEPARRVYKKCAGGVIITASIPDDAQIRGNDKFGYRADKAVITDILGDFCDEAVGISLYNHSIDYHVGQEIIAEDFDFSYEYMTSGFHFFNDYSRAKAF